MRSRSYVRAVATGLGALLLTGAAGMAFADTEYENDGVDVLLDVSEVPAGTLSLSVADTAVTLTEDGSNTDPLVRVFRGVLPDVTVYDTREAANVDPAAMWYVLGTATDFVDQATPAVNPNIPVEKFGWTPQLDATVDPSEVSEGDQVLTEYDSGPGLADQELFALASNSADINPTGSWKARAALELKAERGVAAGSYKSVLTLSLFE